MSDGRSCSRSSRRATRPGSPWSRAAGGSCRNVVASQVALHAPSGGIVPEVAARAHLRWIVPVARRGLGRRRRRLVDDVDGVAVTYGPGLAGSLLVGINFAKALAWVHDKPLVGGQPPRGPRLRRLAARSGRGRGSQPEPVFPLVALVVSGGHTFLAEMRDHLTYRLLGTTVDDAAGEAFDKVGRLLGPRLPGRTGDPGGRRGGDPTRRPRSRGRGWATRTTVSSPGSRPPPAGSSPRPAPAAGLPADDPDAPLPDAVDRGARLGVPGRRRRRARHEDRPGGRATSAPARSCSAAAWPRTAASASGWPSEAEALGVPLIVPRPGLCTDNGAMIGAAGARGSRPASGPASTSTPGRRCRWPTPMSRPAVSAATATIDPAAGPGHAPGGRAARPARALAELPRRSPTCSTAILAEAAAGAGRAGPRDRAGARAPHRRSARRRRAR